MSRWNAYLNTGKRIVADYDGRMPLSAWLKDFFRQHKQMGSRDRKIISELVYSYYRTGHSTSNINIEERFYIGLFLCNQFFNEVLDNFKPAWNEKISFSLNEKIVFLESEGLNWQPAGIFPWLDDVSKVIDKNLFNTSHLTQPDLFLRTRPRQGNIVKQKLSDAGVLFSMLTENCVSLANATKVDQLLKIDEEVVIQDFNSQRVGDFFTVEQLSKISVWDCCAGSGGKSIMAYDLNNNIDLTISDSRPSIIQNLKQRFLRAGIGKYHAMITDLSNANESLPNVQFDCIIADVPCSGSGTWSRTPEQLYFFDYKKIKYYSELQKKIVSNVIPKLNVDGRLVYITCSVFAEENEAIVEFITMNLQLEAMELLQGYERKADSMFVAVFKKV